MSSCALEPDLQVVDIYVRYREIANPDRRLSGAYRRVT